MSLSEMIRAEARRLGFSAVGIARIEPPAPPSQDVPPGSAPAQRPPSLQGRLLEWLQRGFHGTMDWLERAPERRADPRRVLPSCRSLISVGMTYYTGHDPDERQGRGRIARYAWGEDYHRVLRERLEALAARIRAVRPEAVLKLYVDTGPIMEKAWAQQAGVGWIGKHSNLVSAEHGSWLVLGEILTTLDLDPDEPGTDLCGSCSLCIRACPTGAIVDPYVLDATKCISYLTIELRHGEAIPQDLAGRMGNRIFGCDDCLDVCPYNHQAMPTSEPAFQPGPLTLGPPLEALARLTEEEFTRSFRRSAIRRAKRDGLLRNIRIAIQNLKRPRLAHSTDAPALR